MEQYISKSALVAEIESKIEKYTKRGEESDAKCDGCGMYWGGVLSCLNEIRTLCDTLEVKEVQEESISKFDAAIQEGDDVRYNEDLGCRVNLSQLKRVAKKEEPVSKDLKVEEDIRKAMQEKTCVYYNEGYGCSISPLKECKCSSYAQQFEKEEPSIAEIVDEHFWELLGEDSADKGFKEKFEDALAKEWKGYNDRGAATVDALEDNTQELAFAKGFYRGAKWQKENLWKRADGDDLPEIDRGVIVLTQPYPLGGNEYVVSFAHRPNPNGWDGKSVITGKTVHYTPKTYGEGGWNISNIVYWLDVELPKEIEL